MKQFFKLSKVSLRILEIDITGILQYSQIKINFVALDFLDPGRKMDFLPDDTKNIDFENIKKTAVIFE